MSLTKNLAVAGILLLVATLTYRIQKPNAPLHEQTSTAHAATRQVISDNSKSDTSPHDSTSAPRKNEIRDASGKEQRGQLQDSGAESLLDSELVEKTDETNSFEISTAQIPTSNEPEPSNAHWAFEKESYYINLFSEEESLSGFVLNEARCEGQQCTLSFLIDEEQKKDDITNTLMEILVSEARDINVSFDLSAPSHKATLYINEESY